MSCKCTRVEANKEEHENEFNKLTSVEEAAQAAANVLDGIEEEMNIAVVCDYMEQDDIA